MPRGNSGAGHRGQLFAAATFVALLSAPDAAFASFLSGDALDSMAMGIAWGVVIVLPVALIVLFWKLHVLPEKIAEARHHPQKDAIHVLCLLSLFVGGLLWPLAWLVSLPFRLVGITFSAVFAFLGALLMLPARLLGGARPLPA